jgi:hypothetical protein
MARSRYRSVTYHLTASIELARAVALADPDGGQTDMATVAATLSYSGTRNGAFLTRLANARLFGLVAGRSGQVILRDRGRRCLSADPAVARPARVEAFLGVLLFRDVAEHFADVVLPDLVDLAGVLERQFGESPTRAMVTARAFTDSARQAGLLASGGVIRTQFTRAIPDFTDLVTAPRSSIAPQVGFAASPLFRRARGSRQRETGKGGQAMVDRGALTPDQGDAADRTGLWIDEDGPARASRRGSRRAWVTVGAAAGLLIVGVPVGLLVGAGSGPAALPHAPRPPKVAVQVGHGVAKRSVLAALSATTDSGSFAFSYQLAQSPGSSTTTTRPVCPSVGPCGSSEIDTTAVQGSGTIDANPMAMAASADISQNGDTELQVGVRVDPTTVWEVSDTDNGLTPISTDNGATGQPLSGFAGITEGTLGQREGAVAMMGMASPTGYLDLVQPAITGAASTGTATVDGVPVTQYALTIDPSSLATAPGVSTEEATTIAAALGLLTAQGFTTMRDVVSIDASGFIRESSSTVSFGDGGTVTLDAHFSNFGCAGTVLMPGQSGGSNPPANCATPDTGVAPTTTTMTTTTTGTTTEATTTTPPPASTTSTTPTTTPTDISPITTTTNAPPNG